MSTDPSLPPAPLPPPADIDSGDCPNVQLHSDAWPSITISIRNMGPRGPLAISLCKHTPCKPACIFKLALWILQWLVFHLDPDSRCKFVEEWSSNWCARCVHKVQKTFAQNDKNANTGNYIYCTQEKYKSDDVYMSKPAQIESFRVFAGFTRYWDLKPGWYYIKYVWTQ